MKAIMIFDFDDDWIKRNNIKLNNLFGHVVIYEKDSLNEQCDYTNRRYWCFNSLKPLPDKKVGDDLYERYGSWTSRDESELSYRVGYNDCLNDITGENNE